MTATLWAASGRCEPAATTQPGSGIEANPARVHDYWLGGKDNYAADREVGEAILSVAPEIRRSCLDNRAFLVRAVRDLARRGIRQFLDVGTGFPTSPSVHEVAQEIAADARVVYVDSDPVVMAHARALLTGSPQGSTGCVQADVRDPDAIVRQAGRTLDYGRPVGVLLGAVLHFIADADDPHGVVRRLLEPLPPGSALVVSHLTGSGAGRWVAAQVETVWADGGVAVHLRDHAQVSRFFDGLDLAQPKVVPVHQWRPDALTHRLRWWLLGGAGFTPAPAAEGGR